MIKQLACRAGHIDNMGAGELKFVTLTQSALILAATATSVHFLDSDAMNSARSCGVPIFAVALSLFRLASMSLDLRISLMAAFSLVDRT